MAPHLREVFTYLDEGPSTLQVRTRKATEVVAESVRAPSWLVSRIRVIRGFRGRDSEGAEADWPTD